MSSAQSNTGGTARAGLCGKCRWLSVLLAVLALALGMASMLRIWRKPLEERGVDLKVYWYTGHFVLQGDDPYQAWDEERSPAGPLHYLDGASEPGESVRRHSWVLPSRTSPLLLLLAPLARFSWPWAVRMWAALNITLVVFLCLVLARVLRPSAEAWRVALLVGAASSLIATREIVEMGQTSLLVIVLMVASFLWAGRGPTWRRVTSGVMLGIALSKYSVAFPLFLLYVYQREWLELGAAVGVQALGLLAMSLVGGNSPLRVLKYNLHFGLYHLDSEGMHLAKTVLMEAPAWARALVLISLTALVAWLLVRWHRRQPSRAGPRAMGLGHLLVLYAAGTWNLLVLYHRRYDSVWGILLIAIVICGLDRGAATVALHQRRAVYALTAVLWGVWTLPVYQVVSQGTYYALYNLANLCALGLALWMLDRVPAHAELRGLDAQDLLAPCG